MNKLETLANILFEGWDIEDIETKLSNLNYCYSNPDDYLDEREGSWVNDVISENENGAFTFAIMEEFSDILIIGDKIDEIHENFIDLGVVEATFPYDLNLDTLEYFNWLDEIISKETIPMEILAIGNSFSDELQLVVVNRSNTNEILALCEELKIQCKKTIN